MLTPAVKTCSPLCGARGGLNHQDYKNACQRQAQWAGKGDEDLRRFRMKWFARFNRGTARIYLRNGKVLKVKRDPKVAPAEWIENYNNQLKYTGDATWMFRWNGTQATTVLKSDVVAVEAY